MNTKFCDKKCPYLISEYNACSSPEFKGKAYILKRNKNQKYIKICKDIYDKTALKNFEEKKLKFNNHKVIVDGIVYDSTAEYNRFVYLSFLEKSNEISKLRHHVPYVLIEKSSFGNNIEYIADFVYEKDGKTIVEDVKCKSTKTALYRLKKRIMAEKYGIIISEFFIDAL